jgi:4-diphosphocytidyl-2-C-methyl-D-erythritol kinase
MEKIICKSKAKINIGLNIISKRDDGFHNLETIFYPINLTDELTFSASDKFLFESNDENLNKEKTNLIIKAKEQLEKYFDITLTPRISLKKNIPIGAGLGGGSSDAASTLLCLVELYNLKIDNNDLHKLALQLGSDVPYFLNPVPAFAESRGEKLTPINLELNATLLIVNPGIHISTKLAFGLIKPEIPKVSLKSLIDKPKVELSDLLNTAVNDFEKVVFNQYKEIKEIKDKMIEFGAAFSMMTGTGSTVFGFFDDEESAYQTELYFKCKNYFTYIQEAT